MTNQCRFIIDELRNAYNHATAEELYNRGKRKWSRINLTTVNRNLEKLSEMGVIKKYEFAGRTRHYDWDTKQHDHIYCEQCQRINNLAFEGDQKPTLPTEHDSGNQIAGCHYYGVCPECQVKNGSKD